MSKDTGITDWKVIDFHCMYFGTHQPESEVLLKEEKKNFDLKALLPCGHTQSSEQIQK